MSKKNFPTPHCRFTRQEDEQLIEIVNRLGAHSWPKIAASFGNVKTARQYRERYVNYLSPSLSKEPWSNEEDTLLLQLYGKYGPKWSYISQLMPGRSAPKIKNHYVTMKKHFLKSSKDICIHMKEKRPLPLPQIESPFNQKEIIYPLVHNDTCTYCSHVKFLLPSVETFFEHTNSENFYSISALLN